MASKVTSTTVRKDSLQALLTASRRGDQRGRVVILCGPEGIGKTHLLESAEREWRKEGIHVLGVSAEGRVDSDRYGVDATLAALRRSDGLLGEPGVIDGIGAVAGLRARASEDSDGWFPSVAAELRMLFGRIGRAGKTVVTFDDVHNIGDPVRLLAAARRPGCTLVVSVCGDVELALQSELIALADEVIDLEPLTSEQIVRVTGRKLDSSVHDALRVALGPLYGNPGTVLETVEMLRKQGRLGTEASGLRLLDEESPIPLPPGHELLRRVRQFEELGPRMMVAAATLDGIDLDDLPMIADTLGASSVACGQTIDRLVEARVLVERMPGKLTCVCSALAASFQRYDDIVTRRLHTAVRTPAARQESAPALDPAGVPDRPLCTTKNRNAWSDKEYRIAKLVSIGRTNRQIASDLGVSEKTVEQYLSQLFRKTGCRSRVGLVTAMVAQPTDARIRAAHEHAA